NGSHTLSRPSFLLNDAQPQNGRTGRGSVRKCSRRQRVSKRVHPFGDPLRGGQLLDRSPCGGRSPFAGGRQETTHPGPWLLLQKGPWPTCCGRSPPNRLSLQFHRHEG